LGLYASELLARAEQIEADSIQPADAGRALIEPD
jgi:hypothetical protein